METGVLPVEKKPPLDVIGTRRDRKKDRETRIEKQKTLSFSFFFSSSKAIPRKEREEEKRKREKNAERTAGQKLSVGESPHLLLFAVSLCVWFLFFSFFRSPCFTNRTLQRKGEGARDRHGLLDRSPETCEASSSRVLGQTEINRSNRRRRRRTLHPCMRRMRSPIFFFLSQVPLFA